MRTHKDYEIRAYSSILTSLFPEQTKTIPRIIVWSIIFLLDLSISVLSAFYLGLLDSKISSYLLLPFVIMLFWIQGVIWEKISNLFHTPSSDDEMY